MTPEPPRTAERALSEDTAHRLLARAVELDARRMSQVSVAQLRDVAREAGIAPEAFDEALAEFRGLPAGVAVPAKPGLGHALRRWWRNIDPAPSEMSRPRSMWENASTNVLAFAIFWVVLGVFSRISASLDLDWPANHAGNIIANLLGLGVALRLRARVTAVILGVTASAQLARYIMHLLFGIQTVQGGPTQFALMLAGLLGIALGAVLTRSRKPPVHDPPGLADAGVGAGATTQPSASLYGWMFWFSRKKFVGSYLRLSARSRSYLASP